LAEAGAQIRRGAMGQLFPRGLDLRQARQRLTDAPGQGSSAAMNDAPDNDREAARRKLVGRAMVIGLLALVAVYAVFTYLGRR
jgi:hypothetical protein